MWSKVRKAICYSIKVALNTEMDRNRWKRPKTEDIYSLEGRWMPIELIWLIQLHLILLSNKKLTKIRFCLHYMRCECNSLVFQCKYFIHLSKTHKIIIIYVWKHFVWIISSLKFILAAKHARCNPKYHHCGNTSY